MVPFVIEHHCKASKKSAPVTQQAFALPPEVVPSAEEAIVAETANLVSPPQPGLGETLNALVFETCMRKISIHPWGDPPAAKEAHELIDGPQAYQFLLEVLAGLKSPVFGETEVFSQFKTFWEKAQKENETAAYFAPWVRHLIEDVKTLRSELFRDSTTLTWGGAVRKMLRPYPQAWLVGNGELALSVAASLKSSEITYWARRDKTELPGKYHPLSAEPLRQVVPRALVICAPLSDLEMQRFSAMKGEFFTYVMDLRESGRERLPFVDFDLRDLEQLSTDNHHRSQDIQAIAQRRVLELTEKTWDCAWHRPFGWEELCG